MTIADATRRPHQLFMNGDQIYADDVSAALLMQLMDASNTLLGTDPSTGLEGRGNVARRPAGRRRRLPHPQAQRPAAAEPQGSVGHRRGRFHIHDLRSHLMSLGEYLCMYLFTWSDVLWPKPENLATPDELNAAAEGQPKLEQEGQEIRPGDAKTSRPHERHCSRSVGRWPTFRPT